MVSYVYFNLDSHSIWSSNIVTEYSDVSETNYWNINIEFRTLWQGENIQIIFLNMEIQIDLLIICMFVIEY